MGCCGRRRRRAASYSPAPAAVAPAAFTAAGRTAAGRGAVSSADAAASAIRSNSWAGVAGAGGTSTSSSLAQWTPWASQVTLPASELPVFKICFTLIARYDLKYVLR